MNSLSPMGQDPAKVMFHLLVALTFISLFSEMIANSRALVVRSQGSWYFPTYGDIITGRTFGLDYDYETNYRALRDKFSTENKSDWVLMPPIPWTPTETDAQEGVMHPAAPTAARRGSTTAGIARLRIRRSLNRAGWTRKPPRPRPPPPSAPAGRATPARPG